MKISTENPSITIEKNWEEKYKNPFTVKEPYTAVEKKIHKRKKRKDDSRSSDHLSNNGTGRFSDQSWPVKSDCDARRFLLLHYAQRVIDDLAKSSLIRTRPNATTVLTGLFSNLFVLICVCVCVCVCGDWREDSATQRLPSDASGEERIGLATSRCSRAS